MQMRMAEQAIPASTPVQWGPYAYDFESLELARLAGLHTIFSRPPQAIVHARVIQMEYVPRAQPANAQHQHSQHA